MENLVMVLARPDPLFWKDKKVFLTGHTGFKGSWLALWLTSFGAKVTGYALAPDTVPNLFDVLGLGHSLVHSHIADIRDLSRLRDVIDAAQPDIVIHMAAQPLVRYSYEHPVETYATNVMGTVHLLECLRSIDSVRATVIVTTDKCYENTDRLYSYKETDPMGGYDPYSNSKGCAELVTSAYRQSYFPPSKYSEHRHAIASARAGNVIGGGDWSPDRLIPDAIKAFEKGQALYIRNPLAIRPWQHVLEPLSGYLVLAQTLYEKGAKYAGAWNFGPREDDAQSVKKVVDLLISAWGAPATWLQDAASHPHEAQTLKLDISKAHDNLGWQPQWRLDEAINKIVQWQYAYQAKQDMRAFSLEQIQSYNQS
jgi:CDP-glucose 4,6-dehydratase